MTLIELKNRDENPVNMKVKIWLKVPLLKSLLIEDTQDLSLLCLEPHKSLLIKVCSPSYTQLGMKVWFESGKCKSKSLNMQTVTVRTIASVFGLAIKILYGKLFILRLKIDFYLCVQMELSKCGDLLIRFRQESLNLQKKTDILITCWEVSSIKLKTQD